MSGQLHRTLRLPHATALVVGTIIGSAVFVQAAEVTHHVPNIVGVLLVWIVSGILTLFGALACAELATAFPRTGGVYVFLREIYSPLAGFLWGWAMFWVMHSGIIAAMSINVQRMGYRHDGQTLTKRPLDYYRMFYCDTAIQGNTAALMCAYEFFGADHMVFATDTPYDDELGARLYRETIPAVQAMPVDERSRRQIFSGNASHLFRLSSSASQRE